MNTLEDLIRMHSKDLEEELERAGLDLVKLRLAVHSKQSKETSRLKLLRKYIARIKTIRRARELEVLNEKPRTAEKSK